MTSPANNERIYILAIGPCILCGVLKTKADA